LTAVAGLLAHGCGYGECLHPDCSIVDSFAANIRLCGFPREQVVEGSEFSKSFMHLGQVIPVQLRGDLDRLVSVKWQVSSQSFAPNPPGVRLDPRTSTAALLTAVSAGGTHPTDYVFVGAELVFRDGTEGWATVAYCQGEAEWHPAEHIVVVP
jgi:hypothetical protein